ncbi:surface lipoprotein assembly modifier [Neisseria gonorrhoeae]|uniref:surface lipoprotein assembly modifier n=1 Tax=Neisseria gonorrhoeae TaxID=485 RepID=UPI00272BA35C|nr:surface lipoprotein assembly modifier [Neisseria gonorrhoeae]WLF15833.1 surface lipoprotein assembly modifier [Neisseria gonorrhoeae]
MTHRLCLLFLPLCTVCLAAPSNDAADERRRLLDEGSRQTQQYRESGWLDTEQARGEVEENDGYISIGGEIYQVGDTAEELESAIYHALNARQWYKVRQFAARYAKLPRHKPALIHLADALQKRDEGDFRAAGNSFQTALEAEPDNPRLLLEAGRFYAEDNQNKESAAAFEKVLKTDIPAETRPIVENYLSELGKRRRWHGQISLGYGYNSNVNQGNGINQCVWEIAGMCLMERTLPAPTDSTFSSYSATAEKTVPLKGNHGVQVRGVLYGNRYTEKDKDSAAMPDYGYRNGSLYAGYAYADARSSFSLLPYFEYDFRNRHTHYRAWGADADWSRTLSPHWRINSHAGAKKTGYGGQSKTYFADFKQYELGAGAEFSITPKSGLLVNFDAARKAYPEKSSSSKEYTARLGAYRLFSGGTYLNAVLLYRRSLYDAASFVSDNKRRRDKQYIMMAAAGFPQWNIKGVYPELRFRRTIAHSNAVYYRYRQNEWLLGFKYRF